MREDDILVACDLAGEIIGIEVVGFTKDKLAKILEFVGI
jgi:uncharacterized protein YuzE